MQEHPLVSGYQTWLQALNYSKSTVYYDPREVAKFITYQIHHGRSFADWQALHFHQYMDHTEQCPHQRRAGGVSPAHLNKIACALQRFQRYLVATHQGNIYTHIKRYKTQPNPLAILSIAQIEQLYAVCSPTILGARHRVMLGLCYGCGLRTGEACALEVEHIWWERSLLHITKSKTGKSRLVPIPRRVWDDLNHYVQVVRPQLLEEVSIPQVLLSSRRLPVQHSTLYNAFKSLLKQVDLPPTGLHILRHSIASHLAKSGMPSHQIAQFLGHQTLDSTQIYTHLKKESS